ncbi:MAG: hypothetical protein BAJATHORv1_40311 [Candidatus Thorarchaeota archaeon]|nr:MAG: hypothetical protein BAJATHORv1_40311 [Candidatus Thorarchaeota archaeon]
MALAHFAWYNFDSYSDNISKRANISVLKMDETRLSVRKLDTKKVKIKRKSQGVTSLCLRLH